MRVAALEARVRLLGGLVEAVAWLAAGLALAVVLVTVRRQGGQLWPHIFNLLHVVLSGLVAAVSLRLSRRLLGARLLRAWQHFAVAFLTVALLGGGLEAVQLFAPGSPSFRDVAIDLAGGASVLGVIAGLQSPAVVTGRLARGLTLAVSFVALVWALYPSGAALRTVALRAQRFPVLCDFSRIDSAFLLLNDGATMSPALDASAPPGEGWSRQLRLPAGKYPGVEVVPPLGDWSGYRELVISALSQESRDFELQLRVNDASEDTAFDNRFNRGITVVPGVNEFRIPLTAVAVTPRGRLLDLAKVERVVLFAAELSEPHSLRLGSWRLEGDRGR